MSHSRVRTRKPPAVGATKAPATHVPTLQDPMRKMNVAQRDVGELKPPAREFRKHSKAQLRALQASIEQFGVVKPILADANDTIIAGYGVWMAAKSNGLKKVPVICIDHLTAEQVRLYRLADNQIALLATNDDDLIRLELGELADLSAELNLNLDLELTGFSTCEIDNLMLGVGPKKDAGELGAPEEAEEPLSGPAVTRPGDLWLLGDHRIFCGDSLDEGSYMALLGDERAQMVIGDGPFNVPIKGHVSGRKNAREFVEACGELSSDEFTAFQRQYMRHLVNYSIDGSIHYLFMDWRSALEILSAGRQEYTELKNILVWAKTNASRGFYRSQHELIMCYKSGTAEHICTFGIEKGARWRTNVLTYPGCNSFSKTRKDDLADHPTVKNTSLIADLIRDCSKRNGIVLDPFGGSGTTAAAAEWTGRRARLIEIDPLYVDVSIRRWEKQTGKEAIHAGSGFSFAAIASEQETSSIGGRA